MKNEVIFVSGQRGSGKSYWVQNFISKLSRFLIYDTLGEYEGAPRFEEIEDLLDYCERSGGGFLEAIYDPLNPQDDLNFSLFCRIARALGNIYVIIEEFDLFATPFSIPLELQALIKYGRHRGVNVLGVSRRPAEVSRLFTSQATRFILFRQIEPRDVQYFRSIVGTSADMLPTLEPYYFLDIDFSKGMVELAPVPQKI